MAGSNNGQVFQGSALDVTTANVEGNLTVGGTQVLTGAQTLAGALTVAGATTLSGAAALNGATTLGAALLGTGFPVGLPTITNLNASVSGVVMATGSNDFRGMGTITQTASITSSGRVATVSFFSATRYAAAPIVLVINMSQGLSDSTHYGGVFGLAAVGTTSFDLVINNTATFAGAGTIVFGYLVIG